jgi:hypothetical protein
MITVTPEQIKQAFAGVSFQCTDEHAAKLAREITTVLNRPQTDPDAGAKVILRALGEGLWCGIHPVRQNQIKNAAADYRAHVLAELREKWTDEALKDWFEKEAEWLRDTAKNLRDAILEVKR